MVPYILSFFNQNVNDLQPIREIHYPERNIDLITLLNNEKERSIQNIEKCRFCKKCNLQTSIYNSLNELFNQCTFILIQVQKLDKIDEQNKLYIQEMVSSITELNNIFDSIYESIRKKKKTIS